MLITPELKDKLLPWGEFASRLKIKLLDKFVSLDQISFKTSVPLLSDFLSVDRGVVVCLIDHFEEVGLCKVTRLIGGGLHVVLNAKAYDMYRRGGFAAEEYLFQKELLKLEKELENLQQAFPEKMSLFSGVLTLISTIRGFF